MGVLGRDVYRRRLERHLSQCPDEPMINLISAVGAAQSGKPSALQSIRDMPVEALGSELGEPYHIPLWALETMVNELLAAPKQDAAKARSASLIDTGLFKNLKILERVLIKLENAEDRIYLDGHDVFYTVARIAQRQFPWQRGVYNAPHLYRSILLYGTDNARDFFEAEAGITLPDFVKLGACLSGALMNSGAVDRQRDLSELAITPELREAGLAKLSISHSAARTLTRQSRSRSRSTAYGPSVLRDFPIIAFGENGERLRAPIPELITQRYTSGLYLDVVKGGRAIWTGIGSRFETYVLEYLQAMMAPYRVEGEVEYGTKKARYRTPDALIHDADGIAAVVECKAKRMSFDARYADDPVAAASLGFDELAKGIFQIWRFLAHARLGVAGTLVVKPGCQGVIVTADSWLTMARKQAEQVVAAAHAMADDEGGIEPSDRCDIAFCQIDDVEFSLQNGTPDGFLKACREIASGKMKSFMLSVSSSTGHETPHDYPFMDRIPKLLPWFDDLPGAKN